MISTKLTFIISALVASILANNIPILEAGNNKVQANNDFRFGGFDNFAAGRFMKRGSGISQNNPVISQSQDNNSANKINGDIGRNGGSINNAGGVQNGPGSTLTRRQRGSGISQNNPAISQNQDNKNTNHINGGVGRSGGSINNAEGVQSGSALARRQGGSGISQNNPVISQTQKNHITNKLNGDLGRKFESINNAGGVQSGSALARRQGGSGVSQNNPSISQTQKNNIVNKLNGGLGRSLESINNAEGVQSGSGSTLARRQGDLRFTETETRTRTETDTINETEADDATSRLIREGAERVVVDPAFDVRNSDVLDDFIDFEARNGVRRPHVHDFGVEGTGVLDEGFFLDNGMRGRHPFRDESIGSVLGWDLPRERSVASASPEGAVAQGRSAATSNNIVIV